MAMTEELVRLGKALADRQLIAGAEPMVVENGRKPLSIAIDELYQSRVKIVNEDDSPEEEL